MFRCECMDILQSEISALPFVTLFDGVHVESELIRCAQARSTNAPIRIRSQLLNDSGVAPVSARTNVDRPVDATGCAMRDPVSCPVPYVIGRATCLMPLISDHRSRVKNAFSASKKASAALLAAPASVL